MSEQRLTCRRESQREDPGRLLFEKKKCGNPQERQIADQTTVSIQTGNTNKAEAVIRTSILRAVGEPVEAGADRAKDAKMNRKSRFASRV